MHDDFNIDDYILDELRREALADRRYQQAYLRNPDCRDPDHPGCDACKDGEDEADATLSGGVE